MNIRKHIIILTILITIGIGSMILGSRIRKTPAPKEHKREHVQVPSTPSPDSFPVLSDTQEKNFVVMKRKPSTVSTSTSAFVRDHHQYDQHHNDGQSDDGQSETDEESVVLDENMYIDEDGNVTDWKKWKLARMHKHGWFKPEDVPTIHEDPNGQPDGMYIWTKYKPEGPLSLQEPPEHVKTRAKELNEELDRATERGEGREVIRISRELGELHRPYKGPSWVLTMHLGSIPDAWHPYFNAIYKIELQAVKEEFRMRVHKKP